MRWLYGKRRHAPKHAKTVSVRTLELMSQIICFIGIFLFFGALGGWEREAMEFGKALIYAVIGLVVAVAGGLSVAWLSQFEDEDEKETKR